MAVVDYGDIRVILPFGIDKWTKKDMIYSEVHNQLFTDDATHRADITNKCFTIATMLREGVPLKLKFETQDYEYTFDISYKKRMYCVQGLFN